MKIQKDLIARQMKLEEDREARERRRDKKEEESLATGKGIKPPSFKGNPGDRPEAHISKSRRLDGCFETLI